MSAVRGAASLALTVAVLVAGVVAAAPARGAAPIPMPGVAVDGTVHAVLVAGDRLIIGGDFTVAGQRNLAAIALGADPGSSSVEWATTVDGPVHTLAASPNGAVIYVGGEFGNVGAEARENLAAVSAQDGGVTAWNPGAGGAVHALARSGDGLTLYVGGEFPEIGGAARLNLASLSTAIPGGAAGGPTGGALPWTPAPDGAVHAIAVDEAAGRVYAGGSFTEIGNGVRAGRNGLAALNVASAAVLAWETPLAGGADVRALALGDGVVYAGGGFTAPGGRADLVALDAATGVVTDWEAGANGVVQALTLSEGARLYAGGAFTSMDDAEGASAPRGRIAGFIFDGEAGVLMPWAPDMGDVVRALAASADGAHLFAGGAFDPGGGQAGIAVFAVAPPETALDPPGGSFDEPQTVTLACVDRSGAGCARICYAELEEPQGSEGPPALDEFACDPPDDEGRVERSFGGETTLYFFSEDGDGNREALRSAVYAVDAVGPETEVSLPAGLYGNETIRAVELTCEDDRIEEFGCTTYYTLDGSEPDTGSTVYQGPVSLAGLFPDRSIPANEVDPLRHLAGTVTLRFFSVDGAGNEEAPQQRVYDVDLAAPVVTPSLPSGNHVAPIAVALECDDGLGSGCAALYYTLDDSAPALDADGVPLGSTVLYDGAPLTIESAAIVRTLAIDEAGNRAIALTAAYALTAPGADARSGVGSLDLVSLLLGGGLLVARRVRSRRTQVVAT